MISGPDEGLKESVVSPSPPCLSHPWAGQQQCSTISDMSVIFDIFPRCPLNRQHIPCSKYRKKRVPVRVLVLVPFPVPEGITFGQYQHECQYHDHWPVPVARVSVPVRIANLPLQRTPHSITIQFKYYALLLCPPSPPNPPNLRNSVVNFSQAFQKRNTPNYLAI